MESIVNYTSLYLIMGPVLQELIAHCCKLLCAMNTHTQLFKVMKYIHSGNCIHRDLKVRYFLPLT